MNKPHLPPAPQTMLPEVEEFLEAKSRIEAFQEQHAAVFGEFAALAEHYNQLRARAETAVRLKQVSSGPFVASGDNASGNWEELAQILGDKAFTALGGEIRRETTYKMRNETFRILVASGRIKPDVAARVFKEGYRYSMPKPLQLP